MCSKMIGLLSILVWFYGIPAWADASGSGNGGDLIVCQSVSGEERFQGQYSLDYLITYNRQNDNQDIVSISSWEESAKRILSLLETKFPWWVDSFKEYLAYDENTEDYNAPRLWLDGPAGLVDLKDERLLRLVPENCYRENNSVFVPNIIQAVIREKQVGQIIYHYDYDELKTLKLDRPLQYSFLKIHEWLWDHTSDVRVIRRVNRFLHSQSFSDSNRIQVFQILKRLGITDKAIDERGFHWELNKDLVRATLDQNIEELEVLINSPYISNLILNGHAWDWKFSLSTICEAFTEEICESLKKGPGIISRFSALSLAAYTNRPRSFTFLWNYILHRNKLQDHLGQELMAAAVIGKSQTAIRLLLSRGVNLNEKTAFTDQLGDYYISQGDLPTLMSLVSQGLKLDIKKSAWSALQAPEKNRLQLFRYLRKKGVSFDLRKEVIITVWSDGLKISPLGTKIREERWLLSATPFVKAAVSGDLKLVQDILSTQPISLEQEYPAQESTKRVILATKLPFYNSRSEVEYDLEDILDQLIDWHDDKDNDAQLAKVQAVYNYLSQYW